MTYDPIAEIRSALDEIAASQSFTTTKGQRMSEELKQGDEVWVKARLDAADSELAAVRIKWKDGYDGYGFLGRDDIRKLEPSDEVTQAKEGVVEAARAYRHGGTTQGVLDAVDALEAAEKPPLENEISDVIADWKIGQVLREDRGDLTQRILAIVEKHKGESS